MLEVSVVRGCAARGAAWGGFDDHGAGGRGGEAGLVGGDVGDILELDGGHCDAASLGLRLQERKLFLQESDELLVEQDELSRCA
jgi:hypothetical protein